MAFDESLAIRVRDALMRERGIVEKKMFGGLGLLLRGNMLVGVWKDSLGVWKDSLIVRVGPNGYEDALRGPHVRVFDITGKPMKGWVMVEEDGLDRDDQLNEWIRLALSFVGTLAAK